jgi:tripartite-type tricarboxylate transporter receptor subunit TctC
MLLSKFLRAIVYAATAQLTIYGASVAGIRCAVAQDDFYAGKTLRVIVGFPPGGAYDLYSRALAKYLPRHIAGNPTSIIVNMPGAGSLAAANYMFNLAPKDGTEIGSVETFVPFDAFFSGKGVRFDPLKFSWVGALNSEMTACVIWHNSKIKTFSDLFTTPAPFGATGAGAPPVAEAMVMNNVLGTKIKLVTGYPGTPDIFLAMQNGEVEGTCGVGWTTLTSTRGDWLAQGKLNLLVQNAMTRHPSAPQTPLLLDFAKTTEQKELLTLLAAPHRIGRPYLAPPGIPEGRLGILRRAFVATTTDPDFINETHTLKLDLNPVTGAEMEDVFTDISKMDPSIIKKMTEARGDE